ncbi:hypothetical protein M434DRAFT_399340 [Hypoxylon sp. CO27-5]|nr:hypothetical protein M434DRAFT_399340 [Hypoxylon sp. CO27-5]
MVRDLGRELRLAYLRSSGLETDAHQLETHTSIRKLLQEHTTHPHTKDGEDRGKCFIPLDYQDSIITRIRVERELRSIFPGREVSHMVEYVCGRHVCGKYNSKPNEIGKTIFGILSLINKQSSIEEFLEAGIFDRDLPFQKSGVDDNLKLIAKGAKDDRDLDSLRCSSGWSTQDKESFITNQWRMLSPFFWKNVNKPLYYQLDNDVILPWIECKQVDETGGHSDVCKIRIHNAHHGFGKERLSFALKVLRSTNREYFELEFEALKKVDLHNHLVPLLAAFRHQGIYYLIFPWAGGGNLFNFFQTPPKPRTRVSLVRWVAEQCYGLATAVNHIHDVSHLENSRLIRGETDSDGREETEKIFGRHGDIKPENVLLFVDDNPPLGSLKLCDFGLTIFHSAKSKSRDRLSPGAMALTYNAPETTKDIGISRRLDIWCLGCLYLDFITWLFVGPDGVHKFNEARYNEHGSDKHFSSDQFFKTLTIWRIIQKPLIKKSVRDHILELKSREDCSDFLKEFLLLIENNMLRTNDKERIECPELCSKLQVMLDKCRKDETYCSGRRQILNAYRIRELVTRLQAHTIQALGSVSGQTRVHN